MPEEAQRNSPTLRQENQAVRNLSAAHGLAIPSPDRAEINATFEEVFEA